MIFKLGFSPRYGVMGIYKDRDHPRVHIYPLPFVRLTLGLKQSIMSHLTGGWLG